LPLVSVPCSTNQQLEAPVGMEEILQRVGARTASASTCALSPRLVAAGERLVRGIDASELEAAFRRWRAGSGASSFAGSGARFGHGVVNRLRDRSWAR
jgi:hypothetical protein